MIHACFSRKYAQQFENGITLNTLLRRLEQDRPLTPSIPDLTGHTVVLHDYTMMDHTRVARLLEWASTVRASVLFQGDEHGLLPINNPILDLQRAWERWTALTLESRPKAAIEEPTRRVM